MSPGDSYESPKNEHGEDFFQHGTTLSLTGCEIRSFPDTGLYADLRKKSSLHLIL